MTRNLAAVFLIVFLGAFVLGGGVAYANKLEIDPDAPAWAHLGAATLLYLHVGGASIGLVMGTIALASRKGGTVHRAVGNLFFAVMIIAYGVGAGVAPFLDIGQRPNFTGGILALYFVITGWRTARRPGSQAGRGEIVGLVVALTITGMGFLFMRMAANSPTGTVDGSPSEAFIVFAFFGSLAAAGELNVILRRGISGAARIARHLWRMCSSLFFASASFFLGQPQVFPDWFNASPAPYVLSFAPVIIMMFWLVKVRLGGFDDDK